MSNGIKYFVTFTLGAAVGSVAAWSFLKSKYEQLAREEIDEVREYYHQKEIEEEFVENNEPDEDDLEESAYRELVNTHYIEQEGGSEAMNDVSDTPYVITPEEFSSDDEYQSESLTLYACGTLTDDFDNPIEDVPAMVGDAFDHFGEYEDDVVYVRNDRYKCNYEICKDVRTYEEVQLRLSNLMANDE